MTDELRKLWDELPIGPVPLDEVRAEGRTGRPTRVRRLPVVVRRGLVTATALGTVAAAFLIGVQVGPDTGAPRPGVAGPGASDATPVAFHGELRAADSCSALGEYYVRQALDRVGPYGWEHNWVEAMGYRGDLALGQTAAWSAFAPMPMRNPSGTAQRLGKVSGPSTSRAESSDTGTNTQERGVDEPDVAKTDGSLLVTIADDVLITHDVTDAKPRELARLPLYGIKGAELLLSGSTAVVIGQGAKSFRTSVSESWTGRRTAVVSIDLSDPSAPEIIHRSSYDAALLSVRQHGTAVRLVLSAGLPELNFREPRGKTGRRTARKHNQRLVRTREATAWLPQVSDDGGPDRAAVACTDVAIPRDQLGLDTVAVVGFEAQTPQLRDSIGVATEARSVYEAEDRLFLAADSGWAGCCWGGSLRTPENESEGMTHLFDFSLDGTEARYLGSGTVAGQVRDRWSMDWAAGTLRVAVGPSRATRNHNAVVTLAERDDALVQVGRLGRLGVNESIKAVRWFDDLALVVTFRERDPLYAIDLSDPEEPRLLGSLKIPGYSEYLHPLGPHRLIGIGQGRGDKGRWGAQAALFNVTDLTRPRQLDVVHYPANSQALAGLDPRQFTWLPGARTAVTVVQRNWNPTRGFVTVLQPREGRIQRHDIALPMGVPVSKARTVPLPDGRALLVAGDQVSLLDLGETVSRD